MGGEATSSAAASIGRDSRLGLRGQAATTGHVRLASVRSQPTYAGHQEARLRDCIESRMPIEQDNDRRLYVIGDIHGRSDLLERIVREIERDLSRDPAGECVAVTLGDYIDRGPDSRGVLDRLACNPFPMPYIALKGNHEQLLETFLREPEIIGHWRQLGGIETLRSYGVPVEGLTANGGSIEASRALRAALPKEHLGFLQSLRLSLDLDGYFLCHAGIKPGVPFDKQSADDLLWIRDEFLMSTMDFGKIVIHGHTPTQEPQVLSNRINIDTCAFATGRLTCLVLDKNNRRFLST
jgi:serine/threonine protein phosphatase 1